MEPTADDAQESNLELARALGEATGGEERLTVGQARRLAGLAGRSARAAGGRAVASGRWLADVAVDVPAHIPVRDLATLRAHHDGLSGAYLARALIRNASLTSGAVGATTGALAAASEATPATWATLPLELAIETLIVVGVEMKLAGELHEAAGYQVAHDLRAHGPLLARAWSETRGIDPSELARLARPGATGMAAQTASEILGRSARDQLTLQIRRRLMRRAGRNTVTFVPLMAGAVAGGELNRRATRRFGVAMARTLGIPPP
ncbi:MAG TPA: hypothetical protein VGO60_17860 [Iamia sp.]|nr:hypothetical protein [Iamia sp.]